MLVGADALDGAHRPRAEPGAGAVGDAEIHRHADERDVEAGEALGRRRPAGSGADRKVAGSMNGHLRRSPWNWVCDTRLNSGS